MKSLRKGCIYNMITQVNQDNFEEEVILSDKSVLLDFWAEWCGPCKMLSPIVDEIADEDENIKVCKVNVDENEELAMQFGIMSIPTLLVFKNGEIVARCVGFKSKQDILALLD